jgi:orotidine-5'-phosphate decarboxylase
VSETTTTTALPEAIRARLTIPLDVDDLVVALRLARDLQPWFATAKVGLELFSAAGPDAIASVAEVGYDVFYDAKLHDIPNTVGRAAKVLGALGARYVTLHASGGVAMLRAGVEGLREGAASAGLPEPIPLAITVLTSELEASEHVLRQRVTMAIEAGCGGLVCAVADIPVVRELAPATILFTPGIRAAGAPVDDQGRVATPEEAFAAGADHLIVGRPITLAEDPQEAARVLFATLTA